MEGNAGPFKPIQPMLCPYRQELISNPFKPSLAKVDACLLQGLLKLLLTRAQAHMNAKYTQAL